MCYSIAQSFYSVCHLFNKVKDKADLWLMFTLSCDVCITLCVHSCQELFLLTDDKQGQTAHELEMQVITDKQDCSDFRGVEPVEVLIKLRYSKPLFVLMLLTMAYNSSQQSSP